MLNVKKILTKSLLISSFLLSFSAVQAMDREAWRDESWKKHGRINTHPDQAQSDEYLKLLADGSIEGKLSARTLRRLEKQMVENKGCAVWGEDNLLISCKPDRGNWDRVPEDLDTLIEGIIRQGGAKGLFITQFTIPVTKGSSDGLEWTIQAWSPLVRIVPRVAPR